MILPTEYMPEGLVNGINTFPKKYSHRFSQILYG